MKLVPLDVKDMRKNWNNMADSDPYWAVLTHDAKKGGKWSPDEFFAAGRAEVKEIMENVAKLGITPGRGRALDFGCGLGRLTQALADFFDEVTGVDISDGMVAQAAKLSTKGERCKFIANPAGDLAQLASGTFDFVYSSITLQHIDPVYSRVYLREFLRILKPGGFLVFQLPDHRKAEAVQEKKENKPAMGFVSRLYWQAREALNDFRLKQTYRQKIESQEPIIPMHGIVRAEVEALLRDAGGRVVDVQSDGKAGAQWIGYRYYVQKPA